MQQQKSQYKSAIAAGLLLSIGLLGSSNHAWAETGVEQTAKPLWAIQSQHFLGGIALERVGTGSAVSRIGTLFRAYDPEAVGRFLDGPVTDDAPGIDPMQTAAIIPGVFGSVAIPMRNFPVSARWTPVYRAITNCSADACGGTNAGFRDIVKTAQGKGFREKLAGINRGVNGLITYRRDKAVYGSVDYWAKPAEILGRGAGDCEDFAILKMAALLAAGIPAQSMSLVVLQDHHKGVFHAVLSVATGSGTFILDNVRNNVVKDTSLSSYVPLYSFSTDRAWIHGSKSGNAQLAEMKGGLSAIAPGEGPVAVEEAALRAPAKRPGWLPRAVN